MNKVHMNLAFEHFYQQISIEELIARIRVFRAKNLNLMSDFVLGNEISDVFSFFDKKKLNKQSMLTWSIVTYPPQTQFFRVRKIKQNSPLPPMEMKHISDAWNPPASFVKAGRLNKQGESLLYTSPNSAETAIKEMKIESNELFCLIRYVSNNSIKANQIGMLPNDIQLSNSAKLKAEIVMDYLRDEFTRDVGGGTEYLYRISERIAKDYFDGPPRDAQDAWCYPSVLNKPSVNVCFRPDVGKELLTLKGVLLAQKIDQTVQSSIKAFAVGIPTKDSNLLSWVNINDPAVMDAFPGVTSNQNTDI